MGFSTKYTDRETQFVYYGYRYYDPKVGRFLGRDPLQEKGGRHLYAFLRNRGHNGWDVLGQMPRAHYARGGSYGKDDFFFDGGPGFSLEAERSRLDSYASASVGFENRTRAAAAAKNPNKQGYAQVFELDPATGETVAVGPKAPTSEMSPIDFYNGAAGMLVSYNVPVGIGRPAIDIGDGPNKPAEEERKKKEDCDKLRSRLDSLNSKSVGYFLQMAALNNEFSNARTVAGTGMVTGILADVAIIFGGGSAAAGATAKTYMQSSMASGLSAQQSHQVATASSRAAFWTATSAGVADAVSPGAPTMGGAIQELANEYANRMITQGDLASQGLAKALKDNRAEMKPLVEEYNTNCR